jgi:hypothetical protein
MLSSLYKALMQGRLCAEAADVSPLCTAPMLLQPLRAEKPFMRLCAEPPM